MLNILYAGSPDCSARVLERLRIRSEEDGFSIAGVLTNPPMPRGRRKAPVKNAVHETAEALGIPVICPENLGLRAREQAAALKPDLLVCFAYGRIFGPKFLSLFRMGGINLHPSLLPKYRGSSPIPAAILHRDAETGVTVQHLSEKMDSGNILAQERIPLTGTETADSLLEKASLIGADLLADLLSETAASGVLSEGEVQDENLATYTSLLAKDDGLINWRQSAVDIEARVRAFYPWPGAFTFASGLRLQILTASVYEGEAESDVVGKVIGVDKSAGILFQTGRGILAVSQLQRQSKNATDWQSFINGSRGFIGSVCS